MKVLLIALFGITAVIADSSEYAQFRSERGGKSTNCDCGWRKRPLNRIVGGSSAGVGEFPYAVYINTMYHDGNAWTDAACTGSIINRKQILTAAHCLRFHNSVTQEIVDADPFAVTIVYGTIDNNQTLANNVVTASDVLVHPYYDPSQAMDFDIALLTVAVPFKMGPDGNVGPACLPNRLNFMPINELDVVAAGWGLTSMATEDPNTWTNTNILQKVHLTRHHDLENCNNIWNEHYRRVAFHVHQNFGIMNSDLSNNNDFFARLTPPPICTYDAGRSVCPGDSGGPLMWYDREVNRYFLVGVTSFGPHAVYDQPGCIGLNGFTDVSRFIGWINYNLAPEENICTKNM